MHSHNLSILYKKLCFLLGQANAVTQCDGKVNVAHVERGQCEKGVHAVERSGRRSTLRSGATVAFTMLLLKLPSYAVFFTRLFF